MARAHRLTKAFLMLSAAAALAPLSAIGKSACGVDEARVLLDFDVMHPPVDVLHLGTRLDIKVISDGSEIVLDVRNRQTGEPIFDEAPHGSSFYEVTPGDVTGGRDDNIRVLETWIYAVILYIDTRDVRVTSNDRG